MSGYNGRNRGAANGGAQGVQRLYASQLKERDAAFHTYEHLQGLPRGDSALTLLRKAASMVKPIMRKRNWNVQVLAEFLPPEQNLLGLNINRGYKICIRLRYHNNPDLFLPMEQVVDTMLHELSHNVWGAHDANFHRLWDELRNEMETLIRKGYTGEGFLSEGHRLGGGGRAPPPSEMRRLARASAEKRQAQNKLTKGSGQRLGGTPLHLQGPDVRKVIADQITRRNRISNGCGSGRSDAIQISEDASSNTFKTKAEEDDANNRAISQALYDLIEEEEERKLQGTFAEAPTNGGLAWDPASGLYDPTNERNPEFGGNHHHHPSEEEQMEWAMQESTRSTSQNLNDQNLFHQPDENNDTPADTAPPVPVDSKPSPVSAISLSNPPFRDSPISPLTPQANGQSEIQRKAVSTERSASAPPNSASAPALSNPEENQPREIIDLSEPFNPTHAPHEWACEICTCINPLQFLACDACGTERPQRIGLGNRGARPKPRPGPTVSIPAAPIQPQSLGWICGGCGAFMEHKWWTCSACGKMKDIS